MIVVYWFLINLNKTLILAEVVVDVLLVSFLDIYIMN